MQVIFFPASILTQAVNDPSDLRPIAYSSGSFSNMQQRLSATEIEAFAVYQSILKFISYLRGAQHIQYVVIIYL